MSPDPEVSVCIPVRNGASTIRAQLEAVCAQRADAHFEVIVADNCSEDETRAVVESLGRKELVRLIDAGPRPGVNRARNAAAAVARGRKLLFCDADDIVQPGWVQALSTALDDFDGVGGRCLETIKGCHRRTIDMVGVLGWRESPLGANCGVTRQAYERLHGFDEDFVVGSDEQDFFIRMQDAGMTIKSVPDAIVEYRNDPRPWRDELRKSFTRGQGQVLLYSKHRGKGLEPDHMHHVLRTWGWCGIELMRGIVRATPPRHLIPVIGRRAGRLSASVSLRTWFP